MAQHDFTPAWLNFPTAPSPAKPSQSHDKHHKSPGDDHLDNHGNHSNVSQRRRNSLDGQEVVNGGYSRSQRNGWKVRNGGPSEGPSPALRPAAPQHAGALPSRSKTRDPPPEGQLHGHHDNGDGDRDRRRKQFGAEDFPSLNPDAEPEVNRNTGVVAGVWEHPPNPQTRGSRMMVIRRRPREEPSSSPGPPQQHAPLRNGTGLSHFKGPVPKSVSLPVEASRSSSLSPVDQGPQPRLTMRLTRMRSARKSHFLKALKQDMVGQNLHHHCKDDDGFHLQNDNGGGGDENRNQYEHSVSQENGNALGPAPGTRQHALRSSTFPQQEVLSSSLEAEHRLLKEMGWQEESENDETCAPLTEDEMREFQAISEQLQRNGLRRNGLLKNSPPCGEAPAPWKTSNVKMAPAASTPEEETETSSSSSSDTSDDEA